MEVRKFSMDDSWFGGIDSGGASVVAGGEDVLVAGGGGGGGGGSAVELAGGAAAVVGVVEAAGEMSAGVEVAAGGSVTGCKIVVSGGGGVGVTVGELTLAIGLSRRRMWRGACIRWPILGTAASARQTSGEKTARAASTAREILRTMVAKVDINGWDYDGGCAMGSVDAVRPSAGCRPPLDRGLTVRVREKRANLTGQGGKDGSCCRTVSGGTPF
jgi:hypothetical protein